MYRKLFGETIEEQEAVITKKLVISVPFLIASIIFPICLFVPLITWGWLGVRTLLGAALITILSDYNAVVIAILVVALFVIGWFVGIFTFALGVIRLIQIKTGNV